MKRFSAVMVFVMFAGGAAFAQDAKVEAGKAAYTTYKCATCHQIKGTGGKLASALDGVATKLSAADIKKWLIDPAAMEAKLPTKPKMLMSTNLKTKKITPAEFEALEAYLATLK